MCLRARARVCVRACVRVKHSQSVALVSVVCKIFVCSSIISGRRDID